MHSSKSKERRAEAKLNSFYAQMMVQCNQKVWSSALETAKETCVVCYAQQLTC